MASLAGSVHDEMCSEVPGLVREQMQVCRDNPESLLCVSEGARRGILECQSQFRFERWNCSTQQNYTVFGPLLRKGEIGIGFSMDVIFGIFENCGRDFWQFLGKWQFWGQIFGFW